MNNDNNNSSLSSYSQRTSIQQTQAVTPQKRLNVVEIVEWGTSGNRLQSKIV